MPFAWPKTQLPSFPDGTRQHIHTLHPSPAVISVELISTYPQPADWEWMPTTAQASFQEFNCSCGYTHSLWRWSVLSLSNVIESHTFVFTSYMRRKLKLPPAHLSCEGQEPRMTCYFLILVAHTERMNAFHRLPMAVGFPEYWAGSTLWAQAHFLLCIR